MGWMVTVPFHQRRREQVFDPVVGPKSTFTAFRQFTQQLTYEQVLNHNRLLTFVSFLRHGRMRFHIYIDFFMLFFIGDCICLGTWVVP